MSPSRRVSSIPRAKRFRARSGKWDIKASKKSAREQAQSEVERIAREVLTNPVIEEFRCSLAD